VRLPSAGYTLQIAEVWHGTHAATVATATILADAVGVRCSPHPEIDPEAARSNDAAREIAKSLRIHVSGLPETHALLVVSHQPLLDRVQRALCRRAIPLGNSEVVCIQLRRNRRGRQRWVLSPHADQQTLLELKRKIRSKMATAKLLGALLSTLLGFGLAALIDKERFEQLSRLETVGVMKVAVGLLFAAMGLYLITMYAYDALLMPARLWTHDKQRKPPDWIVARPPSSITTVLYLNMIHIWNWLFTPATCMVVLGLLCVAWAVFAPSPLLHISWTQIAGAGPVALWCAKHPEPLIGIFGAAVVALLYWRGRPFVGSTD